MSIFRDRIVLFDGTVIMPDEITRLEVCFINGVDSVEIQTKTRGLYNSQFRTDRPTGMKDSTGKDIFERDMFQHGKYTGVVTQNHCGRWIIHWSCEGIADDLPSHFLNKVCGELTITGMVLWEEGR